MEGSINSACRMEDEREGSSQYTMAPSSPYSPTTSNHREELLRNHELQHASNLSDDSISSALRVDVRKKFLF